ncbi:hypothetical protein NZD89_28835 (plasmid) [Alicyclobacillus fastidiosus]|uniref:Uncharacterized protein n=1 Tax=Alicyclobacillus fastidiosus TaxID=392011 RepID=A0ABY6ZS71_9BACL|nr:hypothetical protein [Alicyclobacillus fastidiosus]WAH44991.1 hypothetical protein NZD89_28835 [Alicyclobacillus fastidiosus]GMA66264.1 hypothetical protein GCM10025859_67060 [Alicyclobacillus fastidiosus]GMA66313.1 hypothetical protein GCM10025859_67550 [Alicyclobacillus fastidiosus]
MSIKREELHRLIDQIPDSELTAAQRYLLFLRDVDPVKKALDAAPVDEEQETDEEAKLVKQALEDFRAGRSKTTDELKRELGL